MQSGSSDSCFVRCNKLWVKIFTNRFTWITFDYKTRERNIATAQQSWWVWSSESRLLKKRWGHTSWILWWDGFLTEQITVLGVTWT